MVLVKAWRVGGLALGSVLFLAAWWVRDETAAREAAWRQLAASPVRSGAAGSSSLDVVEHARSRYGWLASTPSRRIQTDPGDLSDVAAIDGRRVVTASSRDRLQVRDALTGDLEAEMRAHRRGIRCVAVSPDGRRLASGGPDRTVEVRSIGQAEPSLVLRGHESPVVSVAWSADGDRLVSVSLHAEVKVWDARTGEPRVSRRGPQSGVLYVQVLDRADAVVWAAAGGILRSWDPVSGAKRFGTRDIAIGRVSALAIDDDRRLLVTASRFQESCLRIYDLGDGRLLAAPTDISGAVTAIRFLPDAPLLVSVTDRGVFQLWDAAAGTELRRWQGEPGGPSALTVSDDGRLLAAAGPGPLLQLWSRESVDTRAVDSGEPPR